MQDLIDNIKDNITFIIIVVLGLIAYAVYQYIEDPFNFFENLPIALVLLGILVGLYVIAFLILVPFYKK